MHLSMNLFIYLFISSSPEGGGVLKREGEYSGMCAPRALVASSKLPPVLVEMVGMELRFFMLV